MAEWLMQRTANPRMPVRFRPVPPSYQITFLASLLNVKMNKNFAIKKLPKNINYDTKFGTYTLKLKQTSEGLYIERFVHFKQTRIEPNEFKAFKEFYLQLLKYDNLKVLLEQK